jgi:hypothetical protein
MEIKDIRDELNIILTVLKEQERIIIDMSRRVPSLKEAAGLAIVGNNISKVTRMDEHAINIYKAVRTQVIIAM